MSKVPLQGDAGCRPSVDAGIRASTLDEITRLSTTFSLKVKLAHTIDLRAKCGANLVTLPSQILGNEPRVLCLVGT